MENIGRMQDIKGRIYGKSGRRTCVAVDFSLINAMAYNDSEGLVDVFGGRADIEQKVIRCVGITEERFGKMHCVSCVLSVFGTAQDLRSIRHGRSGEKLAGTLSKIRYRAYPDGDWSNCWFPRIRII